MTTVTGTDYLNRSVAWDAEKTAIATERPKYNTGGKLGRVTVAVIARRSRVSVNAAAMTAAMAAARLAAFAAPHDPTRVQQPRG